MIFAKDDIDLQHSCPSRPLLVSFFTQVQIALLETFQRANNSSILYKIRLKFSFHFHTARASPGLIAALLILLPVEDVPLVAVNAVSLDSKV